MPALWQRINQEPVTNNRQTQKMEMDGPYSGKTRKRPGLTSQKKKSILLYISIFPIFSAF